ncbi:MAG: rhodanese-related sulfurtransferase [Beijerinckiaceae bacterium]
MTTSQHFDVAAFYVFQPLADHAALRLPILALCQQQDIKGILLLAPEGLNGTLAGRPEALRRALEGIAAIARTPPLPVKLSHAATQPFKRMKVRLKQEIVTIGDTTVDPLQQVGTYVEPEDWNALLADPDIVLIDTRNGFEYDFGTFKGAIDPKTTSFGEFPDFVKATLDPARHRKVAMFCTGGIRCEKASSYMLREGFDEVFHLKGGILAYLERVKPEDSLWEGSCFVFDERVSLGHGLEVVGVQKCLNCDHPLSAEALLSPHYEEGVSCPACFADLTEERKASARERQKQIKLAEKAGRKHLGPQ